MLGASLHELIAKLSVRREDSLSNDKFAEIDQIKMTFFHMRKSIMPCLRCPLICFC